MRVGDKRKLTIPPQMAYGTSGVRGAIPPNAWLVRLGRGGACAGQLCRLVLHSAALTVCRASPCFAAPLALLTSPPPAPSHCQLFDVELVDVK
jgi:hypothetical protein